jgi:hypothetical protein
VLLSGDRFTKNQILSGGTENLEKAKAKSKKK